MNQELIISGYSIYGDIKVESSLNERTKKELTKVVFESEIKGQKEFTNYTNAIERSELKIKIPAQNLEFIGTKNGYSSSYTDRDDKEQIIYNVKMNIIEVDEKRSKFTGFEVFANMGHGISMNWARTRALSELLIEKGLFASEEYDSKIKFIYERDNEEFRKALLAGTSEDEIDKED